MSQESVQNVDTDGNNSEFENESENEFGIVSDVPEIRPEDFYRLRRYPGELSRQELNDYCVERSETCRAELARQQKILADDEYLDKLTDQQYETLMLSCASLSGAIGAYRSITEFARQKVEEGMPRR